MENFLSISTIDIFIRLSVALLLGMIIGTERLFAHRTAGMRTYALLSMGSALFVIISDEIVKYYTGFQGLNPIMMISQIIVGVGFLGTGMIFVKDSQPMGLTSATGLWVSAGIGMAAGFKLYNIAIIATFLTLFIFATLFYVEERIRKSRVFKENNETPRDN